MKKIDRIIKRVLDKLKKSDSAKSDKLQVKIVLEDGGVIPKKATEGSAGYDLYCPKDTMLHHGRAKIDLNIRLCIPKGYAGIIKPRSGFNLKGFVVIDIWGTERRIECDGKDGVIDSDYTGIVAALINNHDYIPHRVVPAGTRIAQILFIRVEDVDFVEVDSLEETGRAEGGFNSTGY